MIKDYTSSKHRNRRYSSSSIIVIALVFSLVGSIIGAGGVVYVNKYFFNSVKDEIIGKDSVVLQGERDSTVIQIATVNTNQLMTTAEVYAANVNSTVGITTSIETNFWGHQTTSAASGSGFIITEDGYIVTNYHVIEDADSITVSMYAGTTYSAELIGYDENNDLAVLNVEATDLSPVIIGDSDNLNVGDTVIAIGNPLGELTFSLTEGVVSAKDREVTFSGDVAMNLIQTDCAINSGNSGGALFNLYGEVVGITNAKYSSSSSSEASIDNIGFAIPMNSILDIVESIIENGYISTPYIGVSVSDIGKQMQRNGYPEGAAVELISNDSPAEEAGLEYGDIIIKAGETTISSSDEFSSYIGNSEIGDVIGLTVYRNGTYLEIEITVGESQQSALETEEPAENQWHGR